MRLVINKTEAEHLADAARFEVERRGRELAANLLNIARGEGRPYRLVGELIGLVAAVEAFEEVSEAPVADVLLLALALQGVAVDDAGLGDRALQVRLAEHEMVQGALQMAAAELSVGSAAAAVGRARLLEGAAAIAALRAAERGGAASTSGASPRPKTSKP